ncbi:DNA-binding protein inhibitor ID-2 Inhibitor of DNA binding 2 Inhibitor of differentiation 2 [Channa argus]|uniref:DNA-binding protein inhibitor ID-2 Inhibitor of DNA binding 2 Inhibitor of differentiation 2 n=1 Tax=Channa argus TaxID=215402 RepID=A0A6G1QLZ5_CHAAH|nr:DNA-binding protein inhibitor ID-2 Inhibitor of DNA binding 2 Inhibitor of differentiation 2 [Channa argus]KAK2889755.1 hypothetical protein Q8A73_018055 [Channa argus]
MRTGIPVLSAGRKGRRRRILPDFSRNKNPADDPQVPVLLLRDMKLCYRLLRQLVPGLPPGRPATRVEILQHVIDYILDLQTELDASYPSAEPGGTQRFQMCQSTEVPRKEFDVEDSWTLLL